MCGRCAIFTAMTVVYGSDIGAIAPVCSDGQVPFKQGTNTKGVFVGIGGDTKLGTSNVTTVPGPL